MQGLIIAGEASGDIYGSALSKALQQRIPLLELAGMGGPRMAQSGVRLLYNSDQVSVVGLFEVISKLRSVRQAYHALRSWILKERPAFGILIDFPDFNFRIARLLKKQGMPVYYFISPQVWAWRKGRIAFIKKYVDLMICILPFEEQLYQFSSVPVIYVGHPLVEIVRDEVASQPDMAGAAHPVLGIMPGSREVEVRRHLPILNAVVEKIESKIEVEARLIWAPSLRSEDFEISNRMRLVKEHRYTAMKGCDFMLVASGTSTLEAAILGVPFYIVYRVGAISWQIGKYLVRVPYYGLVNWIAQQKVIPEYIQSRMDPDLLAKDVLTALRDMQRRTELKSALADVVSQLGPPGAISRVADAICDHLAKAKTV